MIKFGTGGWRAIIGEDFNRDNVYLFTQGLANLIKSEGCEEEGLLIGHDRRFLSDKAAEWIASVLAANGIKVYFIKEYAPTPLVMYATAKHDLPYGAAVTASHNPYDYNGIKVFTRGGKDADETFTTVVEKFIDELTLEDVKLIDFKEGMNSGIIELIDPFNDYIDSVISMLDIDTISKRRLKVVFDPMFGASKITLNTILHIMRCQVDIINASHNPIFGGRLPSPTSYTLKDLSNLVTDKGYDIGLGTDGDGDRLGIVDEVGEFIHPNDILSILYYYFLEYKGWKGSVVRNIATTHTLDRIAEDFGEKCIEVPVGFKHISSGMDEYDAIIGGESSGGLTIKGHIMGKDATLAAGLMIEVVSVTGKTISEIMEEIHEKYGYTYFEEHNIEFTEESKAAIMKKLFEDKELPDFPFEVDRVSYEDGLKIYFKNNGWVVLRFSGTEPLLRFFVEMPSEDKGKDIVKIMNEFMDIL